MKKDTSTFLKTIVAIPLVLTFATMVHAYTGPITYESTGTTPSDGMIAIFPTAENRDGATTTPVSNGADQNLVAPDVKKQPIKVTPTTTYVTPTPVPAPTPVVQPAPVVQPVVVQQTPTPMKKMVMPTRRTRAS